MPLSLSEMNVDDRKVDLVFRLYVDPADEDYLSARSAHAHGLFYAFYWCAAQACEKYLKAILLLQNKETQNHGHDLPALFRDARQNDPHGLIPELLDLPDTSAMGRELWHGKPSALYIDYLKKYGSPENRYAFYGTFVNGPVLHALDILCHAFRRLMRTTNLTNGDLFAHQSVSLMCHERISEDQPWMLDPLLLLERLFAERYQVGQSRALRDTFSNMNLAFFQSRTEYESSFGGQHWHGSPLHNHLVRLAEIDRSPSNLDVVNQLRDWAVRHIHISKDVLGSLDCPAPAAPASRRAVGSQP